MISREVKEGELEQGQDEIIAYTLTTTPWGSSPTSVVVTLWDITAATWTDVSSTMLSGAASAIGDVITTPLVTGLTAGSTYRLEIKFVTGGNTLEAYAEIRAVK